MLHQSPPIIFSYRVTDLSVLSVGLKYHDTTVRTISSNGGIISFIELPDATCENTAPDMAKKKPA